MLEIIYIHIPKTAGSSILEIFRQNFHSDEIVQIKRHLFLDNPHIPPSEVLLNSIQSSTKVLHGHFTYNELSLVTRYNPEAKIVTFLRDPVERVLSNYTFFKKRILTGKVRQNQLKRANESILDYARLPESQNRMSTFLQGLHVNDLFFAGLVETFEEDIRNLCSLLNFDLEKMPHANKNNLVLKSKLDINKNIIDEIKKLNREDISLYNQLISERNFNK